VKKGIIVGAKAGVGKSYLGKKYDNVLDLESTYFKWNTEGLEGLSEEERKGVKTRTLNPEWPQNYIDEIVKQRENYDIILTQLPHERLKNKEIADYFFEHNIEFYVAMPTESALETILERLRERGNGEDFVNEVRNNFPSFVEEFSKGKYKKIDINDDEYLEDALVRAGLLEKK